MTELGFILLTLSNLGASLILFAGALSERMRLFPTWHKVGLVIAAFGLLAQGLRNIQFLVTGVSPSDTDVPLWALKDIGIAIIAYCYLWLAIRAYLDKNKATKFQQETPKTRVRKKNVNSTSR
jgi:hypothetical protein